MNFEKWYKWLNILAWCTSIFLVGGWWYGGVSLWLPIVIAIVPTAMLLVVVCAAAAWSFYLTRS